MQNGGQNPKARGFLSSASVVIANLANRKSQNSAGLKLAVVASGKPMKTRSQVTGYTKKLTVQIQGFAIRCAAIDSEYFVLILSILKGEK
jgi:hypothetical protein